MAKPKIATVWLAGCAGCHMSFLDIDEAIIGLAEKVEFARSPITDIKEFTPVTVGIVEGEPLRALRLRKHAVADGWVIVCKAVWAAIRSGLQLFSADRAVVQSFHQSLHPQSPSLKSVLVVGRVWSQGYHIRDGVSKDGVVATRGDPGGRRGPWGLAC